MVNSNEVRKLLDAYPRIYFACHVRHVHDEKTQTDLSAHQASILDHLDTKEGTSVQDLASHMGVTNSTMSLNLDRLERGGYVTRQKDPDDGRRTLILLTPSGATIKRRQKVLEPKLVEAMLGELSVEDRARALDGLALLAQAAEQLIQSTKFKKLLQR